MKTPRAQFPRAAMAREIVKNRVVHTGDPHLRNFSAVGPRDFSKQPGNK